MSRATSPSIPFAEPADFGVGLLEAGQIGGHTQDSIACHRPISPLRPNSTSRPPRKVKADRADILHVNLYTIDDGAPRGQIDELTADLEVDFVIQVAVIAIQVIEPAVQPFSVGEVLRGPAVAINREFPGFVDVGDGEPQILIQFDLPVVIQQLVVEPHKLGGTSAVDLR